MFCVTYVMLLNTVNTNFIFTLNIRFSLLLLEFGEVYFEDFTVVYYPFVKREEIEGRLFQ